MRINLIAAMDKNRNIGYKNALPWHLPADLAHFRRTTMGHTIVMGRKTYEAIGKPLPGRRNVVLTRQKPFRAPQCEVVRSLDDVWAKYATEKELYIIGGAEIFRLFLPHADRLCLTLIDAVFPGDTFFPPFDEQEWILTGKTKGAKDEKNPYDYYFLSYVRKKETKKRPPVA
ncbi:dihydrofolate reductase [Bacillaceae bacterium]